MIWTSLLLGLGLLSGGGPHLSPNPGPLQSAAGSLLVSTRWLEENLNRPDLVILHASTDGSDYDEGHIPGARLILGSQLYWDGPTDVGVELRSWREIAAVLEEAGVTNQSIIVVYGSNPMQAARLWMTLDVAGVGIPRFLDGGLQLWREEERPLTTVLPQVPRGRVVVQPHTSRLVEAEWILARLGHDNLALVDARPDDEYTGTDNGLGGRVNPGHIPGARQLYWEELIESRERPVFLPWEELALRFQAAGADRQDVVVTYCQVGLRASVTYMIARLLGYDIRFYDGSWRDWGSRDYPVMPMRGGN
jgi:thiosulfate/3-mercaptopyruvate sulfurtransferase